MGVVFGFHVPWASICMRVVRKKCFIALHLPSGLMKLLLLFAVVLLTLSASTNAELWVRWRKRFWTVLWRCTRVLLTHPTLFLYPLAWGFYPLRIPQSCSLTCGVHIALFAVWQEVVGRRFRVPRQGTTLDHDPQNNFDSRGKTHSTSLPLKTSECSPMYETL